MTSVSATLGFGQVYPQKKLHMSKVYSMGEDFSSEAALFPMENEYHYRKTEKSRIERFALRWLKVATVSLILSMSLLLIFQQFANNELATENEKLRKLNSKNLLNNELSSHPYFEKYGEKFDEFKEKFEKVYETLYEESRRKLIFLNRMQEIDEMNEAEIDNEYGINQFSDMTDDEIKKLLMPLNYYSNLRKHSAFIRPANKTDNFFETAVNHPPRLDWREKGVVTPVKTQDYQGVHCGSCWAFAAVATTESAYAVAHGELRSLSEQELIDCNLENSGCNGGDADKAFRFIHDSGLVSEDSYPYVAHRQNTCMVTQESKLTKIETAQWLNPTEDHMIDWLVKYGPVNVGIAVPGSMMKYKSGVYNPTPYDCKFKVLGLHALLVVGYGTNDDGEKYWIVKNSWGQKWGTEDGYVYFSRGNNACGIEDEPIGVLA